MVHHSTAHFSVVQEAVVPKWAQIQLGHLVSRSAAQERPDEPHAQLSEDAHAMLITAYHLLARQTTYQDPGSDYHDRRQAERARRRAIQTLEPQGFRVALEPVA